MGVRHLIRYGPKEIKYGAKSYHHGPHFRAALDDALMIKDDMNETWRNDVLHDKTKEVH
jgi:hypothetical protein